MAPRLRALKGVVAEIAQHPGDELQKPKAKQRITLQSVMRCFFHGILGGADAAHGLKMTDYALRIADIIGAFRRILTAFQVLIASTSSGGL